MLKPLMRILVVKYKWRKTTANIIVLLISFITILIPFWGLNQLMYSKVMFAIEHTSEIMIAVQDFDQMLFSKTGIRILSDEGITKIQNTVAAVVPNLLGKTAGLLGDIAMMYFILFFLLDNMGKNEITLKRIIPLDKDRVQPFANELESMVYSNVLGAPVLAIVQGITASIGFFIFGLNEPLFWGIICGFMSFIPVVGTAIVWIPAGIYLLLNGASWQGVGLLVFGVLVITNVDNAVRLVMQKKFSDVHPIVTILGVIVGVNLFGFPGLIFGPLVISYFLIMLRLYSEEYSNANS
jgi:predicted PurR-regulated permease PerM